MLKVCGYRYINIYTIRTVSIHILIHIEYTYILQSYIIQQRKLAGMH